jgi:hypothetical protein
MKKTLVEKMAEIKNAETELTRMIVETAIMHDNPEDNMNPMQVKFYDLRLLMKKVTRLVNDIQGMADAEAYFEALDIWWQEFVDIFAQRYPSVSDGGAHPGVSLAELVELIDGNGMLGRLDAIKGVPCDVEEEFRDNNKRKCFRRGTNELWEITYNRRSRCVGAKFVKRNKEN